MMQTGVFSTSSGYLRWRSPSERFTLPYITMSGTSSQWAAGNLQLAHDIVATSSCGTGARASSRFTDHFTLAKVVLLHHPQSLTRSLVFRLRLEPFQYVERFFQSRPKRSNQSLEPTAGRCDDQI